MKTQLLLRTLTHWDFCRIAYTPGKPDTLDVSWDYPTDRDRYGNKGIDYTALDRLIAAGYLKHEPSYGLSLTPRGFAVVYHYRPYSMRAMPAYPSYLNWLQNADTFKRYLKAQE